MHLLRVSQQTFVGEHRQNAKTARKVEIHKKSLINYKKQKEAIAMVSSEEE